MTVGVERAALPSPLWGGAGGGGRAAAQVWQNRAMPWTRDGTTPPSERCRAVARSLRHRPTEPERRLWWHLRKRLPIESTHFRRQVPLGTFVADFCCLEQKLIVEVDGNQHGSDENQRRDSERTRFLAGQGFRVLRFSNAEVMTSMDVVLDTILAALGPTTPTPCPSPHGPRLLPSSALGKAQVGQARLRRGGESVAAVPTR